MFAKADALNLLKHLFVISLQSILKALWKKKIKSKEEVRQLLEKIKEMDNLAVSKEVEKEIFEE
jgi:hypothetical protein